MRLLAHKPYSNLAGDGKLRPFLDLVPDFIIINYQLQRLQNAPAVSSSCGIQFGRLSNIQPLFAGFKWNLALLPTLSALILASQSYTSHVAGYLSLGLPFFTFLLVDLCVEFLNKLFVEQHVSQARQLLADENQRIGANCLRFCFDSQQKLLLLGLDLVFLIKKVVGLLWWGGFVALLVEQECLDIEGGAARSVLGV